MKQQHILTIQRLIFKGLATSGGRVVASSSLVFPTTIKLIGFQGVTEIKKRLNKPPPKPIFCPFFSILRAFL